MLPLPPLLRASSSLPAALAVAPLACSEEVFTHCTTRDLLALRQSCRVACDLLERSEKVRTYNFKEVGGVLLDACGC